MRRLPVLSPGVVIDGTGQAWRRTGACNHCGACCRSGDPFSGAEGPAEVPGACPKLTIVDGVFLCSYRTGRPHDRGYAYYANGCASFPSDPHHLDLYPDCSYRFERIA